MKRFFVALVFAGAVMSAGPVFADTAVTETAVLVTDSAVAETATAVVDTVATADLTAMPATAEGELPGADVALDEAVGIAMLMYQYFKDGNIAMGVAVLWFLLLAGFRRLYMPWLKEKFSKTVRNVLVAGSLFGSSWAAGVLSGLSVWASLVGAVTASGILTLVWQLVGDLGFVKKLTGKAAEEANPSAEG